MRERQTEELFISMIEALTQVAERVSLPSPLVRIGVMGWNPNSITSFNLAARDAAGRECVEIKLSDNATLQFRGEEAETVKWFLEQTAEDLTEAKNAPSEE
jgi:hypothetical protein